MGITLAKRVEGMIKMNFMDECFKFAWTVLYNLSTLIEEQLAEAVRTWVMDP